MKAGYMAWNQDIIWDIIFNRMGDWLSHLWPAAGTMINDISDTKSSISPLRDDSQNLPPGFHRQNMPELEIWPMNSHGRHRMSKLGFMNFIFMYTQDARNPFVPELDEVNIYGNALAV